MLIYRTGGGITMPRGARQVPSGLVVFGIATNISSLTGLAFYQTDPARNENIGGKIDTKTTPAYR
ncbi:hypothetical protein [Dyadobacter sp. 676]|uniref:Uncharacterized protein n=1 Tax=Dyadobacter sp. 676 TaxID=3088362 RepID=A0AAU8FF34_9BACT